MNLLQEAILKPDLPALQRLLRSGEASATGTAIRLILEQRTLTPLNLMILRELRKYGATLNSEDQLLVDRLSPEERLKFQRVYQLGGRLQPLFTSPDLDLPRYSIPSNFSYVMDRRTLFSCPPHPIQELTVASPFVSS